ncbi:MAG TPA: FecR family protein [Chitinophagaceae bacterium]|nr:FecR family protein [Chitinophagaceae bacterium]
MEDQRDQLQKLLEKSGWTAEEMQWLLNYLDSSGEAELTQLMQKQFSDDLKNRNGISPEVSDKLLKAIHKKIKAAPAQPKTNVISLRKIAFAASVIGLVLVATFMLMNKNGTSGIANSNANEQRFKEDVSPGGDKATLTLADGSVIVLDNVQNGTLAQQGNAKIIKLDGKLSYDQTNKNSKEVVYNTIATPKGGQYQLELPDGSLVWLNSSSSIHFPTSFVKKERRVDITGEAYFEVAKDPGKPFIVSVNNSEVQVLGTHFNINSYHEEDDLKTTLLEGSVRFVKDATTSILKPGQQAQLTKNGSVRVVSDVDVDKVVAWKNGLFDFENAGIETVMRQLSRWYDVEVEYNGKTDDLFIAEMRRNIKLSDALKALELTGRVRFDIQGKKIIVMP